MDLDSRRAVAPRTGSVWENRMNEVKGGIKVFNGDETSDDQNENKEKTELQVYKRMRGKQGFAGIGGKRKTWKTEISEGTNKKLIEIATQDSELSKDFDEKECKELSVNVDEIKRSSVQTPRSRSKWTKNLDDQGKELSVADIKKSPIQAVKTRSDKDLIFDGVERSPRGMRTRSSVLQKGTNVGNVCNDELRKDDKILVESYTTSDHTNRRRSVDVSRKLNEVVNESRKSVDVSTLQAIKTRPVGNTTRLDEKLELRKSGEKIVSSNFSNSRNVQADEENKHSEDDNDDEIKKNTKDLDVKKNSVPEQKTDKMVIEDDKIQNCNVKSIPISQTVKRKPPAVVNKPRIVPRPPRTKPTIPCVDEFKTVPNKHSKLQSFVDLVMWRDPSKSAFVFGLGTFIIVSSSYTTDMNISLISVLSYVGLVYLAAIFLFRSIIHRGALNIDDTNQEYVVGEEEAVWLLKLILPYINEFLSKIKALFSGDPATTMKLAVLLFVLARCGSSITIWKMAKLGFFGVFTVPKICSSYSSQFAGYGKFWIRRFKDAWETCSQKKGVGLFVFTVVWNLSSIVARIWAVFMLFVAFRYYQQQQQQQQQQQHSEEWIEEESRQVEVKLKIK
ncbi:Reticulon domain-containing protein [Heracleum sosnowskyi]|uniref:Reticulon-like protein n=1 Tax=Heracleum sosnowskyi TaxID=360622 RepID=A0AAD8J3E7_9APIA|nr:Reticulon domain-containing protein [Heracleum sosnowskyi]